MIEGWQGWREGGNPAVTHSSRRGGAPTTHKKKYEARMMRFNEKGWLKGGVKQNQQGGIEELATGTIEWALGLSKERPSVDF